MFISEGDILEGMKDEHVTEISRMLKRGPTKKYEMGHMPEKGLTNTCIVNCYIRGPNNPKKDQNWYGTDRRN